MASRARFKKGQKVIHLIRHENDVTGEMEFEPNLAIIGRGEKRTDPITKEATYYYWLHYPSYGKEHDAVVTEIELIRFDQDVLDGGTNQEVEAAKEYLVAAFEAKREEERLSEIPSQVRVRVDPELKQVALNEYELITQQGKILPLPRPVHRRPCAAEVIRDWQEYRKLDEDEETCRTVDEIADALVSYFDYALRHFLLYNVEVPFCDEALASGGIAPSEIYGAEHVVRLLIKLPELVPVVFMTADVDAKNVVLLEDELGDFMAWMTSTEETKARLFSTQDEYVANPHWSPPLALQLQNHVQGGNATTKEQNTGAEKQNAEQGATAGIRTETEDVEIMT